MILLFFPALGAGLLGTLSAYQSITGSPFGLILPATLALLAFAAAATTALLLIRRDPRTGTLIALPVISLVLLCNTLALLSIAHDALYPDPRDPYPYEGLPELAFWFSLSFLYFLLTLLFLLALSFRSRTSAS
jgi:hypothetical protein